VWLFGTYSTTGTRAFTARHRVGRQSMGGAVAAALRRRP
jgi:hypothetical protein